MYTHCKNNLNTIIKTAPKQTTQKQYTKTKEHKQIKQTLRNQKQKPKYLNTPKTKNKDRAKKTNKTTEKTKKSKTKN